MLIIIIFIGLYYSINAAHVALRTPFPRSQWTSRPVPMTSTPSAVLTGLPWRTVGRVSTAPPQVLARMAPGAGPLPVSLPCHSNMDPGGVCVCVSVLTDINLYDPQRSRSSVYSQLCSSSASCSWSWSRLLTTSCFSPQPVKRKMLRTLLLLR